MNVQISQTIVPISDELFNSIISQLQRFFHLNNPFKAKLRSMLFEVTYKKGCHILNTGAKQPYAWFAVDGLLQEISVDKDTFATKTTWFWFGFAFVYSAPGFFDREPSRITINVVKDSRVALISYENWKTLKDAFEEMDKLTEVLRSDYEMERKLHLNDMNTLSTVDRYLKYEVKINLLLQHIQLKHVAEFMGMSTDTLGKLRRRFVKEKQSPA